MSPSAIRPNRFYPVYNAGINHANTAEALTFLKYYARYLSRLENVFIEIFPPNFIEPPALPEKSTVGLADAAEGFVRASWSASAIGAAWRTWRHNRKRPDIGYPDSRLGFVPHFSGEENGFSLFNFPNFAATFLGPGSVRLDPRWIELFAEVQQTCSAHKIKCTFFIVPLHARVIEHFAAIDRLELLADLNRALAEHDGTLDFAVSSPFTEEWPRSELDPSVWRPKIWIDQFHYSTIMGTAVMAVLLDAKREERAPHAVLDPRKDSFPYLQGWVKKWTGAHPQEPQRFQRAWANRRSASDAAVRTIVGSREITLDGKVYPIVEGAAGKVHTLFIEASQVTVGGISTVEGPQTIVVASGKSPLAIVRPNIPGANTTEDCSFYVWIPRLPSTPPVASVEVYSLFTGKAQRLTGVPRVPTTRAY